MAFLPGWDRGRLMTADPADVEAARWIVYAQALKPIVDADIEGGLEQLVQADMTPKARESRQKSQRAKARERFAQARRQQAEVRAALELDAEDEATG